MKEIKKTIKNLFAEHERLRNYEYGDLDQFEALERINEIENTFKVLGIKYTRIER